jgi:hypothetical protein
MDFYAFFPSPTRDWIINIIHPHAWRIAGHPSFVSLAPSVARSEIPHQSTLSKLISNG